MGQPAARTPRSCPHPRCRPPRALGPGRLARAGAGPVLLLAGTVRGQGRLAGISRVVYARGQVSREDWSARRPFSMRSCTGALVTIPDLFPHRLPRTLALATPGRFLLTQSTGTAPALEHRLAAVSRGQLAGPRRQCAGTADHYLARGSRGNAEPRHARSGPVRARIRERPPGTIAAGKDIPEYPLMHADQPAGARPVASRVPDLPGSHAGRPAARRPGGGCRPGSRAGA